MENARIGDVIGGSKVSDNEREIIPWWSNLDQIFSLSLVQVNPFAAGKNKHYFPILSQEPYTPDVFSVSISCRNRRKAQGERDGFNHFTGHGHSKFGQIEQQIRRSSCI